MKTTKKHGNKMLLELARYLRGLRRGQFNYAWFSHKRSQEAGTPLPTEEDLVQHTCGTTACAAGYATVLPMFRRKGLQLQNGQPAVGGLFGFDAMSRVLGMSHKESLVLFDPIESGLGEEATAKQVAAHIEKFVESRS